MKGHPGTYQQGSRNAGGSDQFPDGGCHLENPTAFQGTNALSNQLGTWETMAGTQHWMWTQRGRLWKLARAGPRTHDPLWDYPQVCRAFPYNPECFAVSFIAYRCECVSLVPTMHRTSCPMGVALLAMSFLHAFGTTNAWGSLVLVLSGTQQLLIEHQLTTS